LDLLELYLLNSKYEQCEEFFYRIGTTEGFQSGKTHTQRDKALAYYLMVSTLAVQGKNYTIFMHELNKLFRKGVNINYWSYGSYLNWLESCECPESTKAFLRELTNEMEDHNQTVQ
jgi:hypothetical protein